MAKSVDATDSKSVIFMDVGVQISSGAPYLNRIFFMSLKSVTDLSFDKKVLNVESGLVLVDFWAQYCAACKHLLPVLEKLSLTFDNIKFLKFNVEANSIITIKFNIISIPTLILFNKGIFVDMKHGMLNENIISEWLINYK